DEDAKDWPSEPGREAATKRRATPIDATTTADEIAKSLPKLRVGLVHGRLDTAERDRVMRAFKAGSIDVLVATTVIEVGVDVPAATVMVVHDAARFGLAQLHQLRGRVGRGGGASHCLLLGGSPSEDGKRRLDAMVATTDGFRIAEEDLALRGPGELLGPRQARVPAARVRGPPPPPGAAPRGPPPCRGRAGRRSGARVAGTCLVATGACASPGRPRLWGRKRVAVTLPAHPAGHPERRCERV